MRTSRTAALAALLTGCTVLAGCTTAPNTAASDTATTTTSPAVTPSADATPEPSTDAAADRASDASPEPTGHDRHDEAEPVPSSSGAPAPEHGPGEGWPEPVPEEVALRGEQPVTVVWVAVDSGPLASDIEAASDRVRDAGYPAPHTPLTCQVAAHEPLGVPEGFVEPMELVFGVPVYFATTADAEAFVDRFGPVAAVVEGDVFCHFT